MTPAHGTRNTNGRLRVSRSSLLPTGAVAALLAVAPSADALEQRVLYSFTGLLDGYMPLAALIRDNSGSLYGTASGGGLEGGVVFKLTRPPVSGGAWTESVLYSFCSQPDCTDGQEPAGRLLMAHDGTLFGTTIAGGSKSRHGGTVFMLTPPAVPSGAWTESTLHTFCGSGTCSDGEQPYTDLATDASGTLYGTARTGGQGQGVAFSLSPPAAPGGVWSYEILYRFCTRLQCHDGKNPSGGLLVTEAGVLYGTTEFGGTGGQGFHSTDGGGTVFRLTPPAAPGDAWTEKVLYSFCTEAQCADGFRPQRVTLIADHTGSIYGTTSEGGTGGENGVGGTVFEISPPADHIGGWTETVLYSFCSTSDCTDGDDPLGSVLFDKSGALHGTTSGEALNRAGTAFALTPPAAPGGNWTESTLNFHSLPSGPYDPEAGLVADREGGLYGTSRHGGASGYGTVFYVAP